jgi:hypothetical protein
METLVDRWFKSLDGQGQEGIVVLRWCWFTGEWIKDRLEGVTADQARKAGFVVVTR